MIISASVKIEPNGLVHVHSRSTDVTADVADLISNSPDATCETWDLGNGLVAVDVTKTGCTYPTSCFYFTPVTS